MITSLLVAVFGGGSLLGTFITIVYNRRKNRAEAHKVECETSSMELDNYKKMRDIIMAELEPIIKENKELREEIAMLREEVKRMKPSICERDECPNRVKQK